MASPIRSRVYLLGDAVDTDQIIPARRLVLNPAIEADYRELGRHALEGLPAGHPPFVEPGAEKSRYGIIVAGRNFGCGSSREHAPVALAAAGVRAVVARSFARIFFRNCVNGGYLYPLEIADDLGDAFPTGAEAELDPLASTIRSLATKTTFRLRPLGDALAILEAGGIFRFAAAAKP